MWGYFTQICDALLHMHGERIIHRDVKPANVFVSRDGIVKLGDLGLGRYGKDLRSFGRDIPLT